MAMARRNQSRPLHWKPSVREFYIFRIIRRNPDHFGASIASLSKEVSVRCSSHRQISAPDNHVSRLEPVGALRHVCLFTPDLWRRRRQVAIPIIKTDGRRADERKEPRAGSITDHRHCGDGRKTEDTIRAVTFDGMDQRRGYQFYSVVGRYSDKAPFASAFLVFLL